MADLDGVAEPYAFLLVRQQLEKRAEIFGIELLGGHELPQDRAELVAQYGQPLAEELGD
jgi:hypothetical protein